MKLKKDQRKATINITFDRPENDNHKGWYNRIENNGWRPISDKILTPYDPKSAKRVTEETAENSMASQTLPRRQKC
jgi:hypothetical protein